jgi:hypothetical protein
MTTEIFFPKHFPNKWWSIELPGPLKIEIFRFEKDANALTTSVQFLGGWMSPEVYAISCRAPWSPAVNKLAAKKHRERALCFRHSICTSTVL